MNSQLPLESRFRVIAIAFAFGQLLAGPTASLVFAQQPAVQWWKGYSGVDADGADVLGYWNFDGVEGTFTHITIPFDFAASDRIGVWEIQAKELASGKEAAGYVRLIARRGSEKIGTGTSQLLESLGKLASPLGASPIFSLPRSE